MWDILIVSASNETQAKHYRSQLLLRKSRNFIGENTEIHVISDPDGVRIGSGGSTLQIINQLYHTIKGKKVLLIHSGGDSKRIPQYSGCGKLFSSVPKSALYGYPSTLFDEMFSRSVSISNKMEHGMLIMSGDVLIDFDKNSVSPIDGDIVAICAKSNINVAENHGVLVSADDETVLKYLHKKPVSELKEYICDDSDNVLIDTGILYFGNKIIDTLYELTCCRNNFDALINNEVRLNLYGDILYCFAKQSTLSEYYTQAPEFMLNKETLHCRNILWDALHGYTMKCLLLQKSRFIHFGTTKEFIEMMTSIEKYKELGWTKSTRCNIQGDFIGYNSYIEDGAQIHGYIENSVILKNTIIRKNCIISGAWLENIEVPEKTVISMIALNDGRYCVRIYSIDCDTKSSEVWNNSCFPVIENPSECSSAVKNFFAHKPAPLTLSFAESYANADVFNNFDKIIQDKKNAFYLSRTHDLVLSHKIPARKKDYASCELPVRINFAGGWTDTSPYTNEYGGAVLNAAIHINNKNPIKGSIQYNKDAISFISVDLNDEMFVAEIDDIFDFSNPTDNFLIHKAACIALGIIKKDSDINELIRQHGGFTITTDVVDIPKGSGLGTSSLLCAAVVKSMSSYFQLGFNDDDIIRTVITMEQIMTTGGGWQDQVGGLIDGFKLIHSNPGLEQIIEVEQIIPNESFLSQLNARLFLLYSGHKRLARTILRDVMKNVFESQEGLYTISRMKDVAYEMTDCFTQGNFDRFIELTNEHWDLSKKLCKSTSNERIETIISTISDLISSVFICGAGGGGYLQVVLNEDSTIDELKHLLQKNGFDDISIVKPTF